MAAHGEASPSGWKHRHGRMGHAFSLQAQSHRPVLRKTAPGGEPGIGGGMDGTPVYDIKPYVAYADSIPDAVSGFAAEAPRKKLEVFIPENLPLSGAQRKVLVQVLALDPRPAYQENPEREYVMPFGGGEVVFRVAGDLLSVTEFRRG